MILLWHSEGCVLPQGWQGAHTLPREVQLDAESASLLMNPVAEVALLRQRLLYSNATLQLPDNSSSGGLQVTISHWLSLTPNS